MWLFVFSLCETLSVSKICLLSYDTTITEIQDLHFWRILDVLWRHMTAMISCGAIWQKVHFNYHRQSGYEWLYPECEPSCSDYGGSSLFHEMNLIFVSITSHDHGCITITPVHDKSHYKQIQIDPYNTRGYQTHTRWQLM